MLRMEMRFNCNEVVICSEDGSKVFMQVNYGDIVRQSR